MNLRRFSRITPFITTLGGSCALAGAADAPAVLEASSTGLLALASGVGLLATAIWGLGRRLHRLRTDQRVVQAHLQHVQAAAQSKNMFLANVCHEIRTPMTAILGFAEMLEDPQLTHAQRLEHLATVQRNGKHLLAVLNDVLDLSKIEANRLQIERMRCPLVELVGEAVELLRPRAAGKQVELACEFQGPLPETIMTDPTRLRQILLNLIGNAIKFTSQGQVSVLVRLDPQSRPQQSLVRIDVRDTGIGLSPEQILNLFKPFMQGDQTTARRFGGSGLGLVISRRLAQMLGGDITVTSRPEMGTTFSLTLACELPVCGAVPAEDSAFHVHAQSGASGASVAPPPQIELRGRILLAEDGHDNQRLIAYLLRKAGAQVDIVGDGAVAVQQVARVNADGAPYDLVVMDIMMPEMDGLTATRTLREQGIQVPIVALTAHAMNGDRERCLAAGCDDYATKPIDRLALLRTCARLLSRRGKVDAGAPLI